VLDERAAMITYSRVFRVVLARVVRLSFGVQGNGAGVSAAWITFM